MLLADGTRVAVQAGGNAGMYPRLMSASFDRVVTFEPEPTNYAALVRNVGHLNNVEHYQLALTDYPGCVRMEGFDQNSGAWRAVPCKPTESQIKSTTIDLIVDGDVDLIQLDVEGAELAAILGAEKTIQRCWPVIMIERRGHGPDPHGYLVSIGYEKAVWSDTDTVYIRGDAGGIK